MWLICVRWRQKSIERAMDLTDSFTWEDLPTRDAETGHLTPAGWIPLIKMYTTCAAITILAFHILQSTVRIVTNHETIVTSWYPFDWTVSPYYELVNISQVTLPQCYKIKPPSQHFLYYC
jgi:7tm Odorant receptor.